MGPECSKRPPQQLGGRASPEVACVTFSLSAPSTWLGMNVFMGLWGTTGCRGGAEKTVGKGLEGDLYRSLHYRTETSLQ